MYGNDHMWRTPWFRHSKSNRIVFEISFVGGLFSSLWAVMAISPRLTCVLMIQNEIHQNRYQHRLIRNRYPHPLQYYASANEYTVVRSASM